MKVAVRLEDDRVEQRAQDGRFERVNAVLRREEADHEGNAQVGDGQRAEEKLAVALAELLVEVRQLLEVKNIVLCRVQTAGKERISSA